MRRPSAKPDWQKDIARERIQMLFRLAAEEFAARPDRSKRYIALARRIGTRYNVRLGALRRRICKRCGALLVPGASCTVRTRGDRIVTTCRQCGNVARHPYGRKR